MVDVARGLGGASGGRRPAKNGEARDGPASASIDPLSRINSDLFRVLDAFLGGLLADGRGDLGVKGIAFA